MKKIFRVLFFFLSAVTVQNIAAQPTNDDCLNAIPISYGSFCTYATYSNAGATASAGAPAPGCANYTTGDVWFSAVVPSSGHLVFDTQTGTLTDCGMALYSGSCGALTLLYCDDNTSMNGDMPYIDANGLTAGSTIYARMWDYGGDATGDFGLCVYEPFTGTGCGSNPAASDYCSTATPICNLNGYCGNTSSFYTVNISPTNSADENDNLASWTGYGGPFCGSIENNSWLSFVADANTATLDLSVSNCTDGYGIQMQIYYTTDCYSYTPVSNCYNPGSVVNGTVTATGLTPGQTYYIMIDGNAGDVCDYMITAQTGILTVDAGPDVSICAGQSTTLNGSGAVSYSWSPASSLTNPNTANPTASPTATTTYTLVGSGSCPGTNSDAVTVTVGGIAPTAGNNGPLCPGATLNLTSGPASATSYSWTGPNGFTSTSQNPSITSVTPAATGTYTVTVNNSGCTGTATTDVTVNSASAVTASSNGPICAGSDLDLSSTPSGAASYSWSGPNSFTSNVQDPTITAAPVAASGTYTVTVTFPGGCTGTGTVDVVVNTSLSVTAGSNSPLCTNSTLNLTSSSGATYNWSGPNSFTSNLQNPVITPATTANSGTYSVTVTSASGCSGSATTSVTISDNLSPTAGSNSPVCAGGNLNLNTVSGTSYNWSGPNGFTSNLQNPSITGVTPAATGTYSVTVTGAGGCSGSTTTAVTVNAVDDPSFNYTTTTLCTGSTTDVQANITGGASGTFSASPPGLVFLDASTGLIDVSASAPGTYTVTFTTNGACSSSTSITLNVVSIPPADFTYGGPYCPDDPDPTPILGSGASAGTFTAPAGLVFISTVSGTVDLSASTPGTYTVTNTIAPAGGCPGNSATAVITISPQANIDFIAYPISGCQPLTVDFLFVPGPDIQPDSWLWNFDDNGATSADSLTSHTFASPGSYTVTLVAQNTGGCGAYADTTITVSAIPEADFLAHPDVITTDDPVVNFIDYSTNTAHWSWDFGDPASLSYNTTDEQNPDHIFSGAGEYLVLLTVSNADGCTDTTSRWVIVHNSFAFWIPNAFSPNDDLVNDLFLPTGIGFKEDSYTLRIIDRWGKTLYYGEDVTKGWDGKDYISGKMQPDGVYIYMIQVTDESNHVHKFINTVTMMN